MRLDDVFLILKFSKTPKFKWISLQPKRREWPTTKGKR
jgi:hypothetical protein